MNIEILTISHLLFLTREQRYEIQKPFTEIQTTGMCLPVLIHNGITSEPAEEIFCNYTLRNFESPGIDKIFDISDGFIFSFDKKYDWNKLLDIKDGGSGSIYLEHKNMLKSKKILVIHHITIQDISILQKE